MTNMERRIGIRGVYSVLWLMTESLSISIDISINDTKEYKNETSSWISWYQTWIIEHESIEYCHCTFNNDQNDN